ncbi:MAG: Ig-like domain-containing protein, partial [Helicobacteraceae bacterium]|nr:Ig-like domain-containing protein [Helicobacteraceae bacterium]
MPQLYLSLKPTRALRICAAFLLVTLLGCGDASDGSIPNASAQRGFTTMDAGGGALESIELPSLIALWKSQDYTFEPVFTPTDALDKSVVWDSSDASVVAIEQNGTITAKAIGYANITATSATNNAIQASVIVSVDREVARVVSGGNHTVILDSKGEVWVAGRNDCGQLGLGNRDNNSTFVKVKDLQSGVVSVAAGWEHTLAIDSKGDIWAVGCNDYGQLGSGDLNPRDSFERITDKGDIVSVAAGAYHSIALDDKGAIWTTGKNDSGQLGIGSGDSALFAQIPTVSSVTHIAAGNENTLAIDSASQAWIAGDNTYGQLGLGDENPVTLFSRISYIPNIANAAFSAKSAYLLDANGNVWASGYNGVGELGTGSVQYTENIFSIALSAFAFDAYAGYPYALENIVDISAGRDRVLAVDSEGYLWTTKPRDDYFFLIDPDSDYYFKIMCDYYAHGYPVGFCNIKRTFDKVLNVSGVKRVAAGDFYALTLDENGSLWASGVNAYGQLGFGDAEFRFGFAKVPLPLLVICPEGQYLDEITNTCKSLATSIYFVNGVHNTE